MKAPSYLFPSLPPAALLLALAGVSGAQGAEDGGCDLPGMDVVPSGHPYGPVVNGDGQIDRIDVQTNIPITLEHSLAGLDHDASVPFGPNYLTLGFYALSPAEVPLPLDVCSTFYVSPTSPYFIVPSDTLELPTQLNHNAGPVGWTDDVWLQTMTVDLVDPGNEIKLSDLTQMRLRQGPFVDDPTTDKAYNCYYWGHYVWNSGDGEGNVAGNVYWPDNCNGNADPAPGTHPLVVLVHGDGHHYEDYEYLAKHLAYNGFIVASIDGGQSKTNVQRAKRIRTYLGFLRNHWTYKNSVQNNIALMGHSRGGEGVLTAARKLTHEWNEDHDINAVICLAPTDADQDGGTEGLESLAASSSPSLLVIVGSMDEDVAGYCTDGTAIDCGTIPSKPQATGFSIYDRAGGEYSTEGIFLFDSAVTKSLLFVERADHNRWREGCINPSPFVPNPPLNCDTHHDILKGYVNGFLRWRLDGDDDYKPFFTGEWTPPAVRAHGPSITTQYSEGYGRRVIDNFENGTWNVGNLATVVNDLQVTVVREDTLFDYGNFTSPHDTGGMVLRWSGHPFTIDPFIRWTVDPGQGFGTGPYRDFSGFSALSLRIGQMDDAFGNLPGEPTIVYARMRDGSGAVSPNVWIDAFANLGYPHQSQIVTPFAQTKATAKSAMRTARIPLDYFTGVDLDDIVDVELVFGNNGDLQGEVIIDSLELVP